MSHPRIPLEEGKFYHIYNRGNRGINIFHTDENYTHFLKLYAKHCDCVVETYAYCLLRNHFHMLIRVKDPLPTYALLYADLPPEKHTPKMQEKIKPALQFSHFFNAYTQSFNRNVKQKGSLFEKHFERKWVDSEVYFIRLIQYIHQNPTKHGFTDDFREYPYSSYHSHLSAKRTLLKREEVQGWFGGKSNFKQFHLDNLPDEREIEPYTTLSLIE